MSDLIRQPDHNTFSAHSLVRSIGQFFNGFMPHFSAVTSTNHNNNNALFFTYAVMGLAHTKDKMEQFQHPSNAADATKEKETALVGYQARNAFAARLASLVKAQEAEAKSKKAENHVTANARALAERHANSHREYEALVKESEARLAFAKRLTGSKAIFNANDLDSAHAVSKVNESYTQPEFSHDTLNLKGLVAMQERRDFAKHLAILPEKQESKESKETKSTNNAAQAKAQSHIKAHEKLHGLHNVNAAQMQAQGFMTGYGTN